MLPHDHEGNSLCDVKEAECFALHHSAWRVRHESQPGANTGIKITAKDQAVTIVKISYQQKFLHAWYIRDKIVPPCKV